MLTRRGAGGGVRRRAGRDRHRRLHLLPILLGVRDRQRRPTSRPVDAGGGNDHGPTQCGSRVLPRALRRHPDRGRAVGRRRRPSSSSPGGTSTEGCRDGGRTHSFGSPSSACARVGWRRPPSCCRGRAASRRGRDARRPLPRPGRDGTRPGPARAGDGGRGRRGPGVGESIMVGPLLASAGRRPPRRTGRRRRRAGGRASRPLAAAQRGPYLRGAAALASGRAWRRRTGDARRFLHEALDGFAQAQLPMELARTRLGDRPRIAPTLRPRSPWPRPRLPSRASSACRPPATRTRPARCSGRSARRSEPGRRARRA